MDLSAVAAIRYVFSHLRGFAATCRVMCRSAMASPPFRSCPEGSGSKMRRALKKVKRLIPARSGPP